MDLGVDLSEGQTHLDSHADTCVCGANFTMLGREDQVVEYADVSPFSDDYEPIKDILIASCATTWANPEDGEAHVLVFYQSLYFGDKLDHSLLCPNQIRDNGNCVEGTPRQFDPRSLHGIMIQAHGRLNSLFIPLKMQGVVSYLDTRKPNDDEMATARFYEIKSEAPWDPYSKKFAEKEQTVQSGVSGVSKVCNSRRSIQAAYLKKVS